MIFLVNQKYQDLNDIASGNLEKAIRIDLYKKIYNNFFEDKEFIGIDNDTFEPIFELKDSKTIITLNELSSGEKQIFYKGGSLLQYASEKPLIVMIDEPEISMHPEWQQKILNFYREINSNIQFIFATHSPHIVSCCKKEEIRVIEKENNKLVIKEEISGTYGATNENLLINIFNLKSTRNPNVENSIDEYKRLYSRKELLSKEEVKRMEDIKEELLTNSDLSETDIRMLNFNIETEEYKKLIAKSEE